MTDFKYRPDVDGLRAIAVVMVVLYHADFGFSGGFIGVDVFFVISGYLITGLILKRQEAGTFSLKEFWVRRLRRILPSAIAMTTLSLLLGAWLLLPDDFEDCAESAIYQQLMFSNVYFWKDSGYFAKATELKPLMHTWSLAIEEQFYLLYPFLLIWLRRYSPKTRWRMLVTLFVISLVGSEWMVRTHSSAAFFLLPFRAWELILGGLIWATSASKRFQPLKEAVSFASISIILACGWGFMSGMRFPGLSASVPCFATAILIYCNSEKQTLIGKLLSHRIPVFIGLISYSLYLWHWPMLAFLRYTYRSEVTPTLLGLTVLVSLGFAFLSWRYIETPFRRQRYLANNRRLIKYAFGVPAILVIVSLTIDLFDGVPQRLDSKSRALFESQKGDEFSQEISLQRVLSGQIPAYGDTDSDKAILVWGDSHAMSMMAGIDSACKKQGIRCYQITFPGSAPLLQFPTKDQRLKKIYSRYTSAVFDFAKHNHVQKVIMTAYWSKYAKEPEFEEAVHKTLDTFNDAGIEVVVIEDIATLPQYTPMAMVFAAWQGDDLSGFGVSLSKYRKDNNQAHQVFSSFKSDATQIVDPSPWFIDENQFWPAHSNGFSLYTDDNHLSPHGARKVEPLFDSLLKQTQDRLATHPDRAIQ